MFYSTMRTTGHDTIMQTSSRELYNSSFTTWHQRQEAANRYAADYYSSSASDFTQYGSTGHSFSLSSFKVCEVPDKKPFLSVLYPTTLTFMMIKNSLLIINPSIVKLQEKLDDMTEEEEEEVQLSEYLLPMHYTKEDNIWHEFAPSMQFAMFRDMMTYQINRVLEELILPCVSYKTAKALVKDSSKSAIRKYERFGYSFAYGVSMLQSAFRAHVLFFASVFAFNTGLQFYHIYQRYEQSSTAEKKNTEKWQVEIGQVIGFQFVQCTQGLILTAIGAVIGSYIAPGVGTLLGINVIPFVGTTVIEQLLRSPSVS